ncbi:MAG: hypothetical protein RIT01_160 [Pseudomonadota bacterium]|jgi:hypothetical protein
MEDKKQTAVKFLVENLMGAKFINSPFELVEKAKAMERQQIIEAHGNKKVKSGGVGNYIETKTGEKYYEETYGKIS